MKRSPIIRRTPLRSHGSLKRAGKVPARKKPYDPAEKPARKGVRTRSKGDCEVRIPGVCLGRATNFQHRKNDGQGGEYSTSNGLDVCGSGTTGCHGYIHAHPAESYAKGWSVRQAFVPAEMPVYGWFKGWPHWVRLDDKGGSEELSPEEVLALGVKVA